MKFVFSVLSFALMAVGFSQEKAPKALADYLQPGISVKGDVVVVVPPDEIKTYIKKVDEARRADPEWFREHSKSAKPGIPLPFHEKLGLTKTEYAEYRKLWDQRKMEPVPRGQVILRLEEANGKWLIRASGPAWEFTTMRYDPKADTFTSINGAMKRIEDVKADKDSILGAWSGKEWKMENADGISITKENLAIGKLDDGSYGLLIYRLQEISPKGIRLDDKSLIVRFAIKRE